MSAVFLLIAILACGHINTSTATICPEALDVCFVLDGSASNCGGSNSPCLNWALSIVGFAHNMAKRFIIAPDYTQVGLVTFGNAPKVEFYLNKHKYLPSLLLDIDNTEFSGGELTQPGLAATMAGVFSTAAGARSDTRNISVLVTDGAPGISLDAAEAASTALQNAGVDVRVVCIVHGTSGCTAEFARRLSSPPKLEGVTYFLVTYENINFFVTEVVEAICGSGAKK